MTILDLDRVTWLLKCDRCGLPWRHGKNRKQLRDNAKFVGWQTLRRYGSARDFCPACARAIRERQQARRKR
jgi:hypothetical protein